jgi:probable DNA metabolism protein
MGICHSYTPDGRCVSLLKILLTNFCVFDCAYCVNRVSSNVPRARFATDEVVRLTLDFYKRNYIEGLFLSSGIIRSGDYTMEQLVEVARSLREDHRFAGYIHLKTIPDASPELLAAAGRYADRLSINVELPTEAGLKQLAPEKSQAGIRSAMGQLRWRIEEAKEARKPANAGLDTPTRKARPPRFAPAGQSTQMIVGADGANDRDVLHRVGSPVRRLPHAPRVLLGLQPDPGCVEGVAGHRAAAAARASPVPGRLAAALLRLQGGRDRAAVGQRDAGPRHRSQAGLGACAIRRRSRSTSIPRRRKRCCASRGSAGVSLAKLCAAPQLRVPRGFLEAAETAILHADPDRFGFLYRMLLRLKAEPNLMHIASDPEMRKLEAMTKAIRRDIHKMRAFVRFRQVDDNQYIAWFEPSHFIVERNADFFVRRFTGMHWSILTPYRSAYWDGEALSFGPGAHKRDVPSEDATEELWRTYYKNIFNPARLKVKAMQAEMPKKYWRNLPEASLIPDLIEGADKAARDMIEKMPTQPAPHHAKIQARHWPAPPASLGADGQAAKTIAGLRKQADGCRRCPLWRDATQTVFGAGPEAAEVVFVGEQPGDQEDIAGQPFVGPAGKVFDAMLEEAGDRAPENLRHQRGQAFQVRTARQAPHPLQAQCGRGAGLPLVAGPRIGADQAEAGRCARRDGGTVPARQGGANHQDARPGDRARERHEDLPDHPSFLHPAHPRRGREGSRAETLSRRHAAGARFDGLVRRTALTWSDLSGHGRVEMRDGYAETASRYLHRTRRRRSGHVGQSRPAASAGRRMAGRQGRRPEPQGGRAGA